MNQYRQSHDFDEYCQYTCLKCMGTFIHANEPFSYKFCPMCGTQWDGEFTKRRRYIAKWQPTPPDNSYSVLPNGELHCYKPRLIIQRRYWMTSKLSDYGFFTEKCQPQWSPWCLLCHVPFNCVIDGKSSSAFMMKKLKEYRAHYDAVRLILQEGTSFKVIKEWERPK